MFADFDTTSNRLGNTVKDKNARLAAVLKGVEGLKLGDFNEHQIDLFGDAYEFLISNYAANAGKSGGEFFTPQEVSNLLARIVTVGKTEIRNVYDPACGSGSLIIATTEKLKKLGYGKRDFYFIANDIDDRCVKMAFIQCTLLDIPVDFYTGDTLTQKYSYRRPTLTYILNHKQTGYRQYLE